MILVLLSLFIAQARMADSVLPSLAYSRACSTTIELRNLGERAIDAQVEPHRESGSLVALVEQTGLNLHLTPGEERKLTLKLPEMAESAWVAVREMVPDRDLSPVLSVTGQTACIAGERVYSAVREVAHATANPWFEGDVADMPGARLAVVNTSETYAVVTGCYSGGTLISNPNVPGRGTLTPLCTYRFREQLAPFSARQFPVAREGSSHFSLHASGPGIALQMLKLLDAGTQLFAVDSSISFGK
jgi:hypothetical protein